MAYDSLWKLPRRAPDSLTAVYLGFAVFVLSSWLAIASPASAQFVDDFESGNLCAWSSSVGGPQPYFESFTGADSDPWPAPWTDIGNAALADLQGNRARFRPTPSGYSLARLYAPVTTYTTAVLFTLVFENVATQGVGFYVRQNGGYLGQSVPTGQGYGVFVEGFRADPGIGVWREIDGDEQDIQILFDPKLDFQNGVPYRVRFHVRQMDATTTLLQAKIWPVAQSEPVDWHVETTDSTPVLQGVQGGIVLDSWSVTQSPNPITDHTLIDDIEVRDLCP
jgi:hypothetical protein